jgi:signal transduction histidine kinase
MLTEAAQMADRGLQMARSIGAMEHLELGYAMKRDIAVSMNDYPAAYRFGNLYYRYRDSLMGEATARAVMEMEFRSRSRSLEQENESLRVQSSLQTQLMRKRNAFMYSVLGIALLMAAGLALVGYFLRKLRLSSNKLEEKNLVITRQNMQLDRMVRNKDRLMSIIAHDLRGTIGNQLTGLEILNRMQEDQEGTEQDRQKLMKNLRNSASYSLDLLENLLHWSRIDESESFSCFHCLLTPFQV